MGAVLAIKEMSTHMQDAEIKSESSRYLTRMMTRRVYWGKFVRNLYDTEELTRQDYDSWEDWGYNQDASPIPAEGYLDKDNDFRQVYSLNPDEGELNVQFASPRYEIIPYQLIGYHPVASRVFRSILKNNFKDELSDYLDAFEMITPFWYMGDYSHAVSWVASKRTASP
jgi:hypothetical protein